MAKHTRLRGPGLLEAWVRKHYRVIQSFYREAASGSRDPKIVVWITPRTEELRDPPVGADWYSRREAQDILDQKLPALRGALADPPLAGRFYVVASRSAGRFQGSVVGMVPIPDGDADLPPVHTLPVPVEVQPDPPVESN
jgi:hypothetical protein